ncbi:MAG: cell division/cell wall cluster transcriptional repressor MraZ, partial [Bifidobacteriaceae bacterium]|nr:cell division/cell wall cluster transcriptional repressor MraZ [Bifidobacteriaceae bacterium]
MSEAWGGFSVKLDDKHRVIVPPKARPALEIGGTYLTRGQDRCIALFSRPQFDEYREKIRLSVPADMPAVAFDRLFFNSVVTQDMDKQGRVTIPLKLREYASLDRDLMVTLLDNRIEIWDAGKW